jgi:hypothetical protein
MIWLWDEFDGEGNAVSQDFKALIEYVKGGWFCEEEEEKEEMEIVDVAADAKIIKRDGYEIGCIKLIEVI